MSAHQQNPSVNNRASLLAGLRTGGVRSSSSTIPHTAAPSTTSFNIPRVPSFQNIHSNNPTGYNQNSNAAYYPEEDESEEDGDQLGEIQTANHHGSSNGLYRGRAIPMTAAVDGPRFGHQQRMSSGSGMGAMMGGMAMGGMGNAMTAPFSPAFPPALIQQAQNNPLQMQMLHLEMLRIQQASLQLQAHQAQQAQLQAELIAQQQQQQAQQQRQHQVQQLQSFTRERRTSTHLNGGGAVPATAGPMTTSFDLRSTSASAQIRRNQADQLRAQLGLVTQAPAQPQQPAAGNGYLGVGDEAPMPMTASLGGRFGSRTVSLNPPPGLREDFTPPTPATTVISGGTSLGNVPSKSDTATSWRRSGALPAATGGGHSATNGNGINGNGTGMGIMGRAVSSPHVRVTPPLLSKGDANVAGDANNGGPKFRPQPLRFSMATMKENVPSVLIDSGDEAEDTGSRSGGSSPRAVNGTNGVNGNTSGGNTSGGESWPSTPRSGSSGSELREREREEASKKLYEGLGIGRPGTATSVASAGSGFGEGYVHVSVTPNASSVASNSTSNSYVMGNNSLNASAYSYGRNASNISLNAATPNGTLFNGAGSLATRQPRGPPSGHDELGPKNFASRIRRKAVGSLGVLLDARERGVEVC